MRALLVTGLAALVLAGSAGAKTLHVANDGLDTASCGTKTAPCRSITQAIALAAPNDTISVGPGRYGDLDGDDIRGEPGEENGAPGVVDVDKPLHVYSRDGADATVIEATGLVAGDALVSLTADGAVFGKKNGGFTILGADQVSDGIVSIGARTSIVGNVVLAASVGIALAGPDSEASDNRVSLCSIGLYLVGPGGRASRNALVGNQGDGLRIEGVGGAADRNVLVANAVGLATDSSDATISRTLVAGNRYFGASIVGSGMRVESSTFYGNGDGLFVLPNCAMQSDSAVDATGNYWGSPLGPGHDPADLVCTAEIEFEPFATKEKAPKLKPIR